MFAALLKRRILELLPDTHKLPKWSTRTTLGLTSTLAAGLLDEPVVKFG